MPDLTSEVHTFCSSHTDFAVTVPGSRNNVYTVRHERLPPDMARVRLCETDFTCTCLNFRYRAAWNGGYCKHVERVRHLYCGWSSCYGGGLNDSISENELHVMKVMEENDELCPSCGAPTFKMVVAT